MDFQSGRIAFGRRFAGADKSQPIDRTPGGGFGYVCLKQRFVQSDGGYGVMKPTTKVSISPIAAIMMPVKAMPHRSILISS